ncbi:MAG: type 4a pilus biogenesis protein PilO [Pseudomonadota bacterium]|nr:type 4a pilus biogenesis protein PilO [Pseudomonadota bacterium]
MNQLLDRYTKLPRSQRLLLVGLGYVLICVVFFFSLISPTLAEIDTASRQQAELTTKRDQVRARAENQASFQAELETLTAQLKQALKELPNDREIPVLLSEIDGHARKSGLDVRRFQPLAEVMHEYFADVPVQLVMDGSFHEIGVFFDRIRKMNRIVSVQDIEMSDPVESGSETTLKVSAQAVTYRFLTEAEIEAARNAASNKKGRQGQAGAANE